jgi:hypothetical protein
VTHLLLDTLRSRIFASWVERPIEGQPVEAVAVFIERPDGLKFS